MTQNIVAGVTLKLTSYRGDNKVREGLIVEKVRNILTHPIQKESDLTPFIENPPRRPEDALLVTCRKPGDPAKYGNYYLALVQNVDIIH